MVECFRLVPPPWQRLVDYLGRPPSKGWIAQMEGHWYGNSEVSGSSPGSGKFSLPIIQIVSETRVNWIANHIVKGCQVVLTGIVLFLS